MRIVSLCPSLTESVFRLGKGEMLVGRTRFCVQPADRVAAVERVGGTKNPKVDRIVELGPDLVLMNEEENRREDADALTAAGVPVLSSFARDVPGAVSALVAMGAAIGAPEEAAALTAQIEARAIEVAGRAQARPPRRFAYLIWQDPWMTISPGTYIDALLSTAGGRNIMPPSANRYPEVDAGLLRAADLILLPSEPFPFSQKHLEQAAGETGLPRERFRLVDGELLSWHGARTLEGLAYADDVLGGARS